MLSIIMPSLDPNFDKICSTLNSIFQNTGEYEVILILQKTNQEKETKIKEKYSENKKLKVINDQSGIGTSRAKNIALKESINEWILLLDDDVYIKKNTLKHLTANLSNKTLFYYGNALINNTTTHYLRNYIVNSDLNIWSYNRVCKICLIINRKVFNQIGFFDERIGAGREFGSSEESDFILRALLSNIKISYLKDYSVYHELATHSLQKIERYAMGCGALHRKHITSKSMQLYSKFILDLILRFVLLLSLKKKRLVFLKGFFRGFARYDSSKS